MARPQRQRGHRHVARRGPTIASLLLMGRHERRRRRDAGGADRGSRQSPRLDAIAILAAFCLLLKIAGCSDFVDSGAEFRL